MKELKNGSECIYAKKKKKKRSQVERKKEKKSDERIVGFERTCEKERPKTK